MDRWGVRGVERDGSVAYVEKIGCCGGCLSSPNVDDALGGSEGWAERTAAALSATADPSGRTGWIAVPL